jgi:hypothetical protein
VEGPAAMLEAAHQRHVVEMYDFHNFAPWAFFMLPRIIADDKPCDTAQLTATAGFDRIAARS